MQGGSALILAGFKGLGLYCLFSHFKGPETDSTGTSKEQGERMCINQPAWEALVGPLSNTCQQEAGEEAAGVGGVRCSAGMPNYGDKEREVLGRRREVRGR